MEEPAGQLESNIRASLVVKDPKKFHPANRRTDRCAPLITGHGYVAVAVEPSCGQQETCIGRSISCGDGITVDFPHGCLLALRFPDRLVQ